MNRFLNWFICICATVNFSGAMYAQFGNEWINYNQRYFRIKVITDGVHRVTHATLQNSGVPISSIDPRNLQLFYRGNEVPIFLFGTQDGSFDPGDYLEFVGRRNDGGLDTALYSNPAHIAHRSVSMFSDTSVYYLTWNNLTSNLRFINQIDTNLQAYPPANYHWVDIRVCPNLSGYYSGPVFTGGGTSPLYEPGAGFMSMSAITTVSPAWTTPALNNYKPFIFTGASARLELRVVSGNNPINFGPDHAREIRVGSQVLGTDTLDGHTFRVYQYTLTGANFAATGTSPFSLSFLNTLSPISRNALAEYAIRLPISNNMGNRNKQFITLPSTGGLKSGLILQGFAAGSSNVLLYDETSLARIQGQAGGPNAFRFVVPNGSSNRRCLVTAGNQIINVTSLEQVGVDGKFRNFRTEIRDFNYIVISGTGLTLQARKISDFRNFTGYQATSVGISELYDQFSHGIFGHPLSIRKFLEFAHQHWATKPTHVLILGKGIHPSQYRFAPLVGQRLLAPGFGSPASDAPFGFRINGQQGQQIAVGRVAAETVPQAEGYIRKLQAFETVAVGQWMKNIVHMGGGITLNEQQTLAFYLNNFKIRAEGYKLGAKVHTFIKNTSAPIQYNAVDSIRNLINNEGISLLTIFGHGSGQGFDQSIDAPSTYNNQGKYFMLIANSCMSGDLFSTSFLISEQFVLEPDRAAIAFLAGGTPGLSSILNTYTDTLYRRLSLDNMGESIGTLLRNTITANTAGTNNLLRNTSLQMQLHGDPGLRFRIPTLPDMFVRQEFVSVQSDVANDLDSFLVQVVVGNQGAMPKDTVRTSLRWVRNNGTDTIAVAISPNLGFSDTLNFWLKPQPEFFGDQILEIHTDPSNIIEEVNENNNFIRLPFRMSTGAIIPVYPTKYAVIPDARPTLKASTGNPFAELRTYRIELDTTPLFNSSFRRDTTATTIGGVISWEPQILLTDSQVVYWRAGADSSNSGIFHQWRNSSFQYIVDKKGWGMARFPQIKENNFNFIQAVENTEGFSFTPVTQKLKVEVLGCMGPLTYVKTRFSINGQLIEDDGCQVFPAIHVAVINPVTFQLWESAYNGLNQQNNYGNANHNSCKTRVERYFTYWLNNDLQRFGLNSLLDAVPNDYYILAYTYNNNIFNDQSRWPETLIQNFESLGADTIRHLIQNQISVPYIFFAQKGNPQSSIEVLGNSACSFITMETDLETDWIFGTVNSPVIGPSKQWHSLTWNAVSVESVPNDSTHLSVHGIRANGQEDLLISKLLPGTDIIGSLNDSVPASQYPYLRLSMFTRNDQTAIPAHLRRWHVLYEPVPELALNPSAHFVFESDTMSQGEQFNFSTAISNIGSEPADSALLRYTLTDRNNQAQVFSKKLKATLPGETLIDSFTISTINLPGLNQLRIDVNPSGQPAFFNELTLFNNSGSRNFLVGTDRINPMLDVTFDGQHIMNGDIVSPRPFIRIQLSDENTMLALDDTSAFEVFLMRPGSGLQIRIPIGSPEMQFIPASLPENKAVLEYRPDFTEQDGRYELLIRARDKSLNSSGKGSGDFDYAIRFEVISASTITQVLNYPNPFSTSTRFVFTLTGSEIPDELTIRIMTISGVVVREITRDELGPIQIGRNITDFAWDGTDEYGDKLATGVYIYRVFARMNGEELERRNSSADRFFKDGFGKLYIMR
jgi:hypothetical protein